MVGAAAAVQGRCRGSVNVGKARAAGRVLKFEKYFRNASLLHNAKIPCGKEGPEDNEGNGSTLYTGLRKCNVRVVCFHLRPRSTPAPTSPFILL